MNEEDRTKEQYMSESAEEQQRAAELHELEAQCVGAEDKYKRNEDYFAEILNSSKDAIGYATLEGILVDVNDSFLKLTGYSREELLDKKKYQEITPEEYHGFEAQMVEKILRTGQAEEYEKEYIRKDGSRVPVLLTTFIVKDNEGKSVGLAAIIKDITKRRLAEDALLESEERYRTLCEHTYDLISEASVDGRFLYINPNHKDILGYEPSELLDRSVFEYIHPDDREVVISEFLNAFTTLSSGRAVFRYKHKDGQWHWLESTGKPFRTAMGDLRGVIASRDITEQKGAEKALKESEEQYRNLFENVPTGMYRTTPEGSILMANPPLVRMLGYSSFDDLASRNLEKEGFGDDLPRSKFKELLEKEGEVVGLESTWVRQDGTLIHVRESARAIRGEGGTILYYEGTVEDITERRVLYEKSQKQAEELIVLNEDLNKRNKDLEILNTITQAVHQSLTLREVYRIALDKVIELDAVDLACIYLVDEAKNEAVLQDHRGLPPEFLQRAERILCPKVVTWKVINTGEILNVRIAEEDPDIGLAGRDLGFRSMLGIPITLEGKAIGVIWLLSYKEYLFTVREVDLLSSIGTRIAIAIAKAKQTEDLRLVNKDLFTLNRIAIAIHKSLNLQEIYNIAIDTVLNLTSFDILMIYLVDEDTNEAVLHAHSGVPEDYIERAGRIPYSKGVTWKVIKSGEMILIDDIQRDPDLGPAGKALGHHTMLIVPIKQSEKTIGGIGFASLRVLTLSSHDIDFLKTIGSQIGTAIAKAYLFEKSQTQAEELKVLYDDLDKRNRELEMLNAITQAVHQSVDLEEVYKIALDKTVALENVDMAFIYLIDWDRNEAVLQGHRNLPEDYINRAGRIPYPKGITWKIINTGKVLNIDNIQKDPDVGPAGRDLGHHGVLGMPITLEEKVLGVIYFASYKERRFDHRELDLLFAIGNQIAIAIAKAKQTDDLRLVNKDLSTLNKVAVSIHKSLNLQEIYNIAIDTVLNLTAFDILMIYLVDEDSNEAVLHAHSGLSKEYIRGAGRIPYPKGVTWKVIKSGEIVLIDDIQTDPDLGPAGKKLGHHTMLIVPIKKAEKTIGSIGVASHSILELSSQDIGTLKTIGGQIGTAIAKAYLYEESQKQAEELKVLYNDLNTRNKELNILNRITQAVHQSLDLEEVYNIALDMVMGLDNVDMAMIYLVDSDRKEAVLQESRDMPEDYIRRAGRIPYPIGITWKVINSGQIMNVRDAQKDPEIGPSGRDLGHHGILGIPIVLESKAIGVIWLFSYKEHQFDKSEIDLLSSIGNQIALAVAKAKLYMELSKKNRYETIMSTVTRSVHQSINLQNVLENAVNAMSDNIDRADAIGIYMVEGEEAIIKAHKGLNDRFIERAGIIPYPKGLTWKTIIEGKPRYVSDVDEDTSIGPAGREGGIKSYLSMPIRFGEKSVGCVNINSLEKNAFDEEELKLLQIVVQQIESAINNAQIAEQLRLKSVIVGNMAEGIGLARTSDNIIVYVNPTFEKMFGYNQDELLGKSTLILSPFGDKALEHPEIKKIIECVNQKGMWSGELLHIKKDGTSFWSLASVSTFDHPQHGKVWVGIHTDITERKQAEEQLKTSHEQLRNLAAHLQFVREEERTTISREIHDELAQVLTGLKMSLSWLDQKLSETGDNEISRSQMLKEIETMSKLIDDTIQWARRVATELRPRILDDFGLIPAIEWQVREFQARTGIKCKFSSNQDALNLDQERSTAIFRIFQEALTNVMRHADASRVNIRLMQKADQLVLEVKDNGKGITRSKISNTKSLGILGMRERAIFLGGGVEIIGTLGKGTKIIARIPLTR